MTEGPEITLDESLMVLNGWLGRPVRLFVAIRLSSDVSEIPPTEGRGDGWHLVLAREAQLRLPAATTQWERDLSTGTYELGEGPLKLFLYEMPCSRILSSGPSEDPARLLFHLASFPLVVLGLELI